VLCVAKDETSVDIMRRSLCWNFLPISRLWQIWLARRLMPDVSTVYIFICIDIYVWSIVEFRGGRSDLDEIETLDRMIGVDTALPLCNHTLTLEYWWFWTEWSRIRFDDWSVSGWTYRPGSLGGRPFRLGVETALPLCNHSLTFEYVDVSMRSHRVKIERQATH
jgi:hypothetical protein